MNKIILFFFVLFILLSSCIVVSADPPNKVKPDKPVKHYPIPPVVRNVSWFGMGFGCSVFIPGVSIEGSWSDWSDWWVICYNQSVNPVDGVWGSWSDVWLIINYLEVDECENCRTVKVKW